MESGSDHGKSCDSYARHMLEIKESELHKMHGHDELLPYVLKKCKNTANYLSCCSKSVKEESLPMEWKTANIMPIFNEGDREIILNYRLVSRMSTVSKTLEFIIRKKRDECLQRKHSK